MISAVIYLTNDRVIIHDTPVEKVDTVFHKGFYETYKQNQEVVINRFSIPELHDPFDSEESKHIIKTVRNFFAEGAQERVNQLGFTHKLGILLHGIQGTGKTSLLNYIASFMVEECDAIVFIVNKVENLTTAIPIAKEIRKIQNNPIIFIGDEFERYATNAESEMKNFLDGVDSINNMMFLASTNYLDRIPKTLKENRPSRFKIVQEIKGITNKESMFKALKRISDKATPSLFTDDEIRDIFKNVNSITLDQIKEICLSKVTDTFVAESTVESKIGFVTSVEEKPKENKENKVTNANEIIWTPVHPTDN